ncbi:MAG: hypothetical protein ACRYHC_06930, partial [Janthinobacterium lividum]
MRAVGRRGLAQRRRFRLELAVQGDLLARILGRSGRAGMVQARRLRQLVVIPLGRRIQRVGRNPDALGRRCIRFLRCCRTLHNRRQTSVLVGRALGRRRGQIVRAGLVLSRTCGERAIGRACAR